MLTKLKDNILWFLGLIGLLGILISRIIGGIERGAVNDLVIEDLRNSKKVMEQIDEAKSSHTGDVSSELQYLRNR